MNLVTTAISALVGAALFELLRVPAGALIGATVAVSLLSLTNLGSISIAVLPASAQFLSFAALGWLIGQGITREVLRSLASRAVVILVVVAALLILGGGIAVVLVRLGLLDPATAFLATSPGALSQMTALSAAVGADAAVVATLHTVRVVAVILIAPLVLKLIPGSG